MKKLVLLLIISLLTFSIQAQDSTWTIVKSNPQGKYAKSRVGYFFAGTDLKVKLGKVKPGTKVYPIAQREDVYHIRFKDGQIGWVYFTMLKETRKLEITKNTALYSIKGSSSYRMGKFIDSLKKGDIVTQFGLGKGGGFHKVISDKGKKGAAIRQYAIPAVQKDVPKYNTKKAKIFLLRKDITEKIINKSDSNLRAEFGMHNH